MSEASIETPEIEVEAFHDRASLRAELQEIARSKAPEHATASRGFWAKLLRRD